MLRSGRQPTTHSEKMIVNNYMAMRFIREHRTSRLTPSFVFSLHRMLTDGTLEDSSSAGRFRTQSDQIAVEDNYGTVLHRPPPADELDDRLARLCLFANRDSSDEFLHPVIRAVILHFWLGYDHPFVDGNGRTARALFYWSMLSQGYWLAEFLSISMILNAAPSQYARSFLYTETDGNDLTYFLEYHLGVIRRAIDELVAYLDRKAQEVRRVDVLLRESVDLNHRQLALLSHAMRHPGSEYVLRVPPDQPQRGLRDGAHGSPGTGPNVDC